MEKPTQEQLDKHRKEGFRPSVVACLINNKRILMFYKKEYKLWLLPQGGIKNKEDPNDSLKRELKEELGPNFMKNVNFKSVKYVGEDKIEFKPGKHDTGTLKDSSGKEYDMVGKYYYFAALECETDELDIKETEFDEHFWMSYREAKFLAEKIYQRGKKRITTKILDILFEKELINE